MVLHSFVVAECTLKGKTRWIITMKLGIILPVCEESFIYAHKMGLDFVEFDVNGEEALSKVS